MEIINNYKEIMIVFNFKWSFWIVQENYLWSKFIHSSLVRLKKIYKWLTQVNLFFCTKAFFKISYIQNNFIILYLKENVLNLTNKIFNFVKLLKVI